MKALQFMATGRPVVVSPVGIELPVVRDGVNGLLARSTDDWVTALKRLADGPALRNRLGTAARAVQNDYSAVVSAAKFAEVVGRVLRPTR